MPAAVSNIGRVVRIASVISLPSGPAALPSVPRLLEDATQRKLEDGTVRKLEISGGTVGAI